MASDKQSPQSWYFGDNTVCPALTSRLSRETFSWSGTSTLEEDADLEHTLEAWQDT